MAANDKQLRALRDRKRAGNDRAERIAKIEEEIRKREEEKAADMFEQQRIKELRQAAGLEDADDPDAHIKDPVERSAVVATRYLVKAAKLRDKMNEAVAARKLAGEDGAAKPKRKTRNALVLEAAKAAKAAEDAKRASRMSRGSRASRASRDSEAEKPDAPAKRARDKGGDEGGAMSLDEFVDMMSEPPPPKPQKAADDDDSDDGDDEAEMAAAAKTASKTALGSWRRKQSDVTLTEGGERARINLGAPRLESAGEKPPTPPPAAAAAAGAQGLRRGAGVGVPQRHVGLGSLAPSRPRRPLLSALEPARASTPGSGRLPGPPPDGWREVNSRLARVALVPQHPLGRTVQGKADERGDRRAPRQRRRGGAGGAPRIALALAADRAAADGESRGGGGGAGGEPPLSPAVGQPVAAESVASTVSPRRGGGEGGGSPARLPRSAAGGACASKASRRSTSSAPAAARTARRARRAARRPSPAARRFGGLSAGVARRLAYERRHGRPPPAPRKARRRVRRDADGRETQDSDGESDGGGDAAPTRATTPLAVKRGWGRLAIGALLDDDEAALRAAFEELVANPRNRSTPAGMALKDRKRCLLEKRVHGALAWYYGNYRASGVGDDELARFDRVRRGDTLLHIALRRPTVSAQFIATMLELGFDCSDENTNRFDETPAELDPTKLALGQKIVKMRVLAREQRLREERLAEAREREAAQARREPLEAQRGRVRRRPCA